MSADAELEGRLRALIRDIPDFPEPGVVFKDITPLLIDVAAFTAMVEALAAPLHDRGITKILAVEARGFIPGAALAPVLGAGFVPVRKAGKLPAEVEQTEYVLEYGTDVLEVHRDAVTSDDRVVIVDDVLATGGTAAATVRLARALGGEVVACSFVIELEFLNGRTALSDLEVHRLVAY